MMLAEWLERVRDKLNSFRALEENWDSYGARPVKPEAIDQAIEVATGLASILLLPRIPEPHVEPVNDGTVTLWWGDETVAINCDPVIGKPSLEVIDLPVAMAPWVWAAIHWAVTKEPEP